MYHSFIYLFIYPHDVILFICPLYASYSHVNIRRFILVKYWRNLCIDYRCVAVDIYKECQSHPQRAIFYGIGMYFLKCGISHPVNKMNIINNSSISGAGILYYSSLHNPNEVAFRDKLINSTSRLVQIGEPMRNPISVHYVKWLEQCYNEGIIRRTNFGIFSILWLDTNSSDCALYKNICTHLKPPYITLHRRIIDLGFLDDWWVLKNRMYNYDVNDYDHSKQS